MKQVLLVIITLTLTLAHGDKKTSGMDPIYVKYSPSKNEKIVFIPKSQYDSYQDKWTTVVAFQNKGRPQSALKEVEEILALAKKDKNPPQIVKAHLHRIKFLMQIGKDELPVLIKSMEDELKQASFPEKPVLQSLLAEIYWNYFQANRYYIYKRTKTAGHKETDLSTWSLAKLMQRIGDLYRQSLLHSGALKRIKVGLFDDIISKGNTYRKYRPTLYDFLAHRAVDFFMTDDSTIIRSAHEFYIDSPVYFSPAKSFIKIKLASKDPAAFTFNALKIFQHLTAINLKTAHDTPAPLIDVELKRLEFVLHKSILANKDTLYIEALRKLEKAYNGRPEASLVTYYIASWYKDKGAAWDKDNPVNHKWSIKKAYTLCETVMKTYPQSEGAAYCKPFNNSILSKNLSLQAETANLPGKPFRSLLSYANVDKIYFRVVKVSLEFKQKITYDYMNSTDIVNNLRKLPPVRSWSVYLPSDPDFRSHSVEAKIPPLKSGLYAVLASTDKDVSYDRNAVAYLFTDITKLAFTHKINKKEGIEINVVDRDSGKPQPGVSVILKKRKYSYLLSRYYWSTLLQASTDNKGIVRASYSTIDVDYYGGTVILLQKDKDVLETSFNTYSYSPDYKDSNETFFFTDRSIYRPGQTIYFKGIVLRKDSLQKYTLLPGTATTVTLFDRNYRKISQLSLTSNQYGSVSGSFTAPVGVLTGTMSISNEWGRAYISVEEYKRPKFETKFIPIKGKYRLNDTITIKGSAMSYSGAPLSNAKVSYNITRRTWFPYTWYGWYYRSFNNKTTVIAKGTISTDQKGIYTISFKALPDKNIPASQRPSFYYNIHADVIDINGETHSAADSIQAGYTSLLVSSNLPASVNSQEKFSFDLYTTNFSGEHEPTTGTITIARISEPERIVRKRLWPKPDKFLYSKKEFISLFPHDIYNDENDFIHRKKEKIQYSFSFNTANKKPIMPGNIKRWKDGRYIMEVNTTDPYGTKIYYKKHFSVFSPVAGACQLKKYYSVSVFNNTVLPGEKARFLVESGAKDLPLQFELVRNNNKVERRSLTLHNNKKIISFPVSESDRGNINYRYVLIKHNRFYSGSGTIYVPWSNKQLTAKFITFRNKILPGQQEEWRIKLSGPQQDKVAAELVATLYDASLDSFKLHYWNFNVNPYYYNYSNWLENTSFNKTSASLVANNWNNYVHSYYRYYDRLNLFGIYFYGRGGRYRYYKKNGGKMKMSMNGASGMADMSISEKDADKKSSLKISKEETSTRRDEQPSPAPPGQSAARGKNIQIRTNMQETAFFYPHLLTDKEGDIIISFKAPEALTKWKFMGLAHTKDLKSIFFTNELVTQKQLMLTPNVPRFLREGDSLVLNTKISNLTDKKLNGTVELLLFDALTMQPVDAKLKNTNSIQSFSAPAKGNSSASWKISIPESVQAVTWRVIAKADVHSDGEEAILPVLSNRVLVTESMPLPIRGNQKKNFLFKKLLDSSSSKTLQHHRLTLEFTSNPVWYAVQALPYLMEYPHECAEQVFSRFYANSLASHIVGSSPRIKQVFDQWKSSDALLSNLQKNQELKSVLLEETPWVLNAQNEEQNKKRVALLFDLNRMSSELDQAFNKLRDMQGHNGGWPWFKGLPESWYITQHITAGLAKLERLGITSQRSGRENMQLKAVAFIDAQMHYYYTRLLYKNHKNISYIIYHYLYTRSFFTHIPVSKDHHEAFDYWIAQAKKYWVQEYPYTKGLAAIALHRFKDTKTAQEIIVSLKEHAIQHDELGMYWKENVGGYYWYQAPIETQSLLIEAFSEITKDRVAVDDMRLWLLKMKQVQHWKTTKATTDACYALLLGGTNWFKNTELVKISLGDMNIDPVKMGTKVEAGTGYFKLNWHKNEIKPGMGKVTVNNVNDNPAWGALHWQYFESLDNITPHETPLKLHKKIFKEFYTDKGPVIKPVGPHVPLKPGDKLIVRIELRVDRDMDYIHMKDLRASGTEPMNVLSRVKYQDGLYYYESTKDTATHFFFDHLPKGTYVFEYPLRVNIKGNFQAGIASIQCMYAPEFNSHSAGMRIKVE